MDNCLYGNDTQRNFAYTFASFLTGAFTHLNRNAALHVWHRKGFTMRLSNGALSA